jgi:hypothetical protein
MHLIDKGILIEQGSVGEQAFGFNHRVELIIAL